MTPTESDTYWDTLALPALRAERAEIQRLYAQTRRSNRTANDYAGSRFRDRPAVDAIQSRADVDWEAYRDAFNRYHCETRPAALSAAGLAHLPAAQPAHGLA